jgi:flagellar basal body P-ring protein FlgI
MRSLWANSLALLCGLLLFTGCSVWNPLTRRSQSPDESAGEAKLVGDLAVPYGMFPVNVESVGLVTRLPGTGSDPVPSVYRAALISDMKARNVTQPNEVLASKNTALVIVRGVLRPGIQKGDTFDLEVRTPSRDETTSLRGGWLMEARLKEMAVLDDSQVHEGRVWGLAEGAVMVDPSASTEKDRVAACRGRVLGGGRATGSRSLGLVLKPNHQNVYNASLVASAINKRFHSTMGRNIQDGVAKAHTDQYIELAIHPRYKDNIQRYMQVVRAIALRETPAERLEHLALLEKQMLDPITTGRATRQLEAIGRDGIDILKKGIASPDAEVRFCSAETLAYLDESAAAKPLAQAALEQPAFRVFALTALSAMNDYAAYEQLCALLNVPSAETRYGAFRALWAMNPADRMVRGETLGNEFGYHVLATTSTPMIHVTRSTRPEIVLFGNDQRFGVPLMLEAGPRIRVNGEQGDQISVSKFAVGEPDQKRIVTNKVDDVIRAIVDLGGTYPDVVQALQQAKTKGVLTSRFEVDALPDAGRKYERVADADHQSVEVEPEHTGWFSGNPLPSLFGKKKDSTQNGDADLDVSAAKSDLDDSAEEVAPSKSFFARMTGR